jgi:hypothetical protein
MCNLSTKHGSDKGSRHNYTTFYNLIFDGIKLENLNIFEVGLGTNNINVPSNMGISGRPGASLRLWKDYFPNSLIYGADVDEGCLFQEERIKTFFVDQTNSETIQQMWLDNFENTEFDILIDDGLHEFNANKNFFDNSILKLRKGGIYILEDIDDSYVDDVKLWFDSLISENKYSYINIVTLPITTDVQSNNRIGIIIK